MADRAIDPETRGFFVPRYTQLELCDNSSLSHHSQGFIYATFVKFVFPGKNHNPDVFLTLETVSYKTKVGKKQLTKAWRWRGGRVGKTEKSLDFGVFQHPSGVEVKRQVVFLYNILVDNF